METQNNKKLNKLFVFFIKLAVTVFLVWFLFSRVDFGLFLSEIKNANIWYLIAAELFFLIGWWLNSVRWLKLLLMYGVKDSVFGLFMLNMSSVFYSAVLPGGKVSGELARVYRVYNRHKDDSVNRDSLAVISLLDRALGLLDVFFVIFLFLIFWGGSASLLGNSFWPILVFIGAAVFASLFFIFSKLLDDFMLYFKRKLAGRFALLDKQIDNVLILKNSNRKKIFLAFAVSLSASFLSGLSVYFSALAVGLSIGYLPVLFSAEMAAVLLLIPITLAGIGLREGSLVYFLVRVGVSPVKALTVSTLNFLVILCGAVIGGVYEARLFFMSDTQDKKC